MIAGRRWYLTGALACAAIAIYGSFVPFEYHAHPWSEALSLFARIRYLHLGVDSRADFVSNILLFVPLGYLLMGALRVDRRGASGAALAATTVMLICAVLSIAIEFTQVFFPPRTVSINDIVAETAGGCIGVVLWTIAGQRITEWLRAFLLCRERAGLAVHLLTLYAVLFVVSEMLPLDITISPVDLADKYRQGRVVLVPFSYGYASPMLALWDYLADVLLHLPIGAVALVGWTRDGRWRRPVDAFVLGCAFVFLVEAAQLLVFSRFSSVTDLILGAIGVALGIALTRCVAAHPERLEAEDTATVPLWPWAGVIVWIGALMAYHWYPFDFVRDPAMLTTRLPKMFAAPFTYYYWGSEFQAFTEISRKFLMALPLGVFLRLTEVPTERRFLARLQAGALLALACLVLLGIEMGQLLLPMRIADVTDVGIGEAGVVLGFLICGALLQRPAANRAESPTW